MCPDWELNWWPFAWWDDAQPSEPYQPMPDKFFFFWEFQASKKLSNSNLVELANLLRRFYSSQFQHIFPTSTSGVARQKRENMKRNLPEGKFGYYKEWQTRKFFQRTESGSTQAIILVPKFESSPSLYFSVVIQKFCWQPLTSVCLPCPPFWMGVFIVAIPLLLHCCKLDIWGGRGRLFVFLVHRPLEQEEPHPRPWARYHDRLDCRLSLLEREWMYRKKNWSFMTRRADGDRVNTMCSSTIFASREHREKALFLTLSFRYVGGWVCPMVDRRKWYALVSAYIQENCSRYINQRL